jgi:CheY-like chemotaxis protein
MRKRCETEGGIAVLVVDDEPLVRMDTAEMLQEAGFDVNEASNPDEALKKKAEWRRLPARRVGHRHSNGRHHEWLCACQAGARSFPEAAIVLMSGVARPPPGDMPPNATFLAKPVIPERLVRAIKDALARSEYRQSAIVRLRAEL